MKKAKMLTLTTLFLVVFALPCAFAGQGGPDQTGYRWVDSDEPWGPEYEWIDISEVGNSIAFYQPHMSGPFDIGFSFPFYGELRNNIWVSSFGYLTFIEGYDIPSNTPIPYNASPNFPDPIDDFIAMFWEVGLRAYWPNQGNTYYYKDEVNNRFIISFVDIPFPNEFSGSLTFQAILNADGSILFQYGRMDSGEFPLHGASVGIENQDGTDGLEVVFGVEYIHSDMAILIYPDPLYSYDVAPKEFTSPYGPVQVADLFTPSLTVDNLGSETANFDVNLTISYDGSQVYTESVNVSDLEHYDQFDVVFPDFMPSEAGAYSLTATTSLVNDENTLNDSKTVEFEVWPEFLEPAELTGINSQYGVAPVYWFEPGMPPCSLVVYDDGVAMNGGNEAYVMFANEFEGIAPSYLCTTYVHVLTSGDVTWPWPYGIHVPAEIKVFGDADGNGIPDTVLVNIEKTPEYGEWITCVFEPPLVITSDKFWVSYNMIVEGAPPFDVLNGDDDINYWDKRWTRGSDGVWHKDGFGGDRMIRAAFRTHTVNTMLTDIEDAVFMGYNLYRSTEPDVPIGDATRILELTTETSYNDENVTNGDTYYYVVTAVYETNEGNVESEPSNEISVTPAEGGELTLSASEIVIDTLPGEVITFPLTLTNDGDIPVDYTITPTVITQSPVTNGDPNDYGNGFRDSFASMPLKYYYEADRDRVEDTPNIPVVTESGGPDDYGYYWVDSNDPHGPEYAWIDPSEHQVIDFLEISNPLQLEFDFPFYGVTYNSLRVCKLGYILFEGNVVSDFIEPLPHEYAPPNMIAPFWEVLSPSSGEVTFYSEEDLAVITWIDFKCRFTEIDLPDLDPYTFQLVLFPDGRILFQYHTMGGPPASNSVGIQGASMDVGLGVSYQRPYCNPGVATLIGTQWLSTDQISGTIPASSDITVNVAMDATSLQNLIYEGNLYVTASDINGDLDPMDIPVSLDLMTGIDDDALLPAEYSLNQNYPNPFNAQTSIEFALKQAGDVELCVYNTLGQKIATLISGGLDAGIHSVNWDASEVSSGMYFYKLETDEFTDTKKMLLLK